MPRNSSGTYSLPAGNPVVTGTTISSSWANTTLSDIGTALTDSLSRSGDGAMTAPLELAAGVVGAPGLSWSAETTSGLYRAGVGDFRYSISSTDVLQVVAGATRFVDGLIGTPGISFLGDTDTGFYRAGSGNIRVSGNATLIFDMDVPNQYVRSFFPLHSADGAVGTPSFTFVSDPDTGIYRAAANRIGFSTSGGLRFTVDSTFVQSEVDFFIANSASRLIVPDGTVALPSMTFVNDLNTGIYREAADDLRLVAGGVQVYSLTPTLITAFRQISITNGSAGNPSITFTSDANTGIYSVGADEIGVSAGGSLVASFVNTGSVVVTRFGDGSATVPSQSFFNDTNTGFFRDTADQIGIALGGVTAGQIAQGSFTAGVTGLTTSPTATATWQRIGKMVFLSVPQISGTSNSTSFTLTNIPAAIQPSIGYDQEIPIGTAQDNGVEVVAPAMRISNASSSFSFLRNASAGGWTASGTKLFRNMTIAYKLS